jgi:hypothetical protein
MLGAYHFTHQYSPCRPFTAEAETHQCAKNEKLCVVLREAAQKRENGEPRDGNLQRAHASKTIGKRASEPSAEGGSEQCHGADQAGIRIGDCEGGNDRRDHEAKNLHIHGIEHPAAETRPECAPLTGV